jgi:hypothetical protein
MGVRESMNKRPMIAGGVTVIFVAAALVFVVFQLLGLRAPAPDMGGDPEKGFFTVDDGRTWFIDAASQLSPFQHEGKEAVRAYVVDCNGKKFVNHLERYTPEGKQAMLRLREITKKSPPPGSLVAAAQQKGREVKRPADAKWMASNAPGAEAIAAPRCPPGASGDPTFVYP